MINLFLKNKNQINNWFELELIKVLTDCLLNPK